MNVLLWDMNHKWYLFIPIYDYLLLQLLSSHGQDIFRGGMIYSTCVNHVMHLLSHSISRKRDVYDQYALIYLPLYKAPKKDWNVRAGDNKKAYVCELKLT